MQRYAQQPTENDSDNVLVCKINEMLANSPTTKRKAKQSPGIFLMCKYSYRLAVAETAHNFFVPVFDNVALSGNANRNKMAYG